MYIEKAYLHDSVGSFVEPIPYNSDKEKIKYIARKII